MAHYHWSELFPPHIWQRGLNYHRDGHILSIHHCGNYITAEVEGSEIYNVSLTLDERTNRIEDFYCDCPYGEDGTPCKHLAALLCALEEEQNEPLEMTDMTESEQSINSTVQLLSPEQMRQLLIQLAQTDSFVREKILLMTSEQFPNSQRHQWQLDLQNLTDEASDRSGFIDYEDAYEYCSSLADYLNDRILDMLQKGFIMEAFELVCMVFQTGMEQEMDDSDGGLSMLAGCCIGEWDNILELASAENQKEIYRWFSTEYKKNDLSQMFLDEYIFNASWNLEIVPELLSFLDQQIRVCAGSDSSYRLNGLIAHRINWMEKAGISTEEKEEYLQKHHRFPAVREYEISRAKRSGDWKTVIARLEESKILDADKKGLVAEYSQQLIEIYEKINDFSALRHELEYYLFSFHQDDLKHVDKMKAILPASEWEEMRSRLLDSASMKYQKYPLLHQEGMYGQLMDCIEAQSDIHSLERYEKVLKREFPQRCIQVYTVYLHQAMLRAYSRREYRSVIQTLKKLKKYPEGKATAQAIAEQWKQKYPRRTSMVDELRKAGF